MRWLRTEFLAAAALAGWAALAGGCAALSSPPELEAVQALTRGKTFGTDAVLTVESSPQTQAIVQTLLVPPLSAENAVRVALLNNPGLQSSLAALGVGDAERAQMGGLSNPHLSLGRFAQADQIELERVLKFDVLSLITLPWRARWAGQQSELAGLQAAQEVVKLAADTRKAWIRAVAASQTERYLHDAQEAAEAGSELARRLAQAGNWSWLEQARQQSLQAEATAQRARAQQAAFAAREDLTRLMGLWGEQTLFKLPERLPELPSGPLSLDAVEAMAISDRLDVAYAKRESAFVAESLGLPINPGGAAGLDVSMSAATVFNNASGTRESRRGLALEFPLPIFDAGQNAQERSRGLYQQTFARTREVAVRARSEAREAYHGYRTAYDLARHYRDTVVPLHRRIQDEMVLRYNGMIAGLFDLLADARASMAAVNASLEAQRDFWLADADLQTTLTGTSPTSLSAPRDLTPTGGNSKGH